MKRKHRKLRSEADLDITAFMNLMIVLVPILLINMIFAHTSVLELNFPTQNEMSDVDEKTLQLQVMILEDKIVVSDNQGGVIKQIKNLDKAMQSEKSVATGAYDFETLSKVIQELKTRVPEKKDITIMAQKATSYQTLVSVMDKVRSYKTVVAGSVVNAELFPEVSISDAPEIVEDPESLAELNSDLAEEKVNS